MLAAGGAERQLALLLQGLSDAAFGLNLTLFAIWCERSVLSPYTARLHHPATTSSRGSVLF